MAATADIWSSMAAGALSGLAARVVTFPADTLKARMQLCGAVAADAAVWGRTLAAARHMLFAEGPASFYRGFGAVLWGVVPANLAYFGGYESGKRLLPAQRYGPLLGDLGAGALAQLAAGLVYTPIDIIKERQQVQGMMRGAYSLPSAAAALTALARQGPRGAFKGFWATNAVWLPWNVLYVAGYEALKREAAAALGRRGSSSSSSSSSGGGGSADGQAQQQQQQQQQQPLPAWAVASCSAAAAAAAAVVTHPADVVKTRLQVLAGAPGAPRLTALSLARRQLAAEGVGSFWHGLVPRLLHIAPGCAISWALYEQLKGLMGSSGGAARDDAAG